MTARTSEAAPASAPSAARGGRWRPVAFKTVRILFTVAVLAAIVYTTVRLWRDVRDYFFDLAWQSVLLSLVMVLAGLAAGTMGWRAALTDVGHRVPVRTASHIYLIGLLAKYLPGSVWAFVLQMELGRRADLPRSRSFLASIVATGVGTTVALLLGVFGLPALRDPDVGSAVAVLFAVLVPVALVCTHPRVLTWLVQRFLAVVRRPPLAEPITWRGVGAIAGWSMVAWVCLGVHLWLLANAEVDPGVGGVFRAIGAMALGMTAGFFAFLVPSGIGVREAIIVAALLPYVPPGVALGMALTSRMLFVVGDLIAAGVAGISWVREKRAVAAAAAAPPT